jgi:hypothetical protein
MHYERAVLLSGVYRGDGGQESEEKIGKSGRRMALYLEGKTPLLRLRKLFKIAHAMLGGNRITFTLARFHKMGRSAVGIP